MNLLKVIRTISFIIIVFIAVCSGLVNCVGDPLPNQYESADSTIDSLTREIEMKDSLISILYNHLPFGKPVDSIDISSSFGYRRNPITRRKQIHLGIDLRADRKDTVYATANGVVSKSGWYGGYGRNIKIEHEFNYTTSYSHLHRIFVDMGDTVNRNQPIGLIGSTGFSTGPHLHYEIVKDGDNIDPIHYVYFNID
jgi:murein DD-endopeptidase MepM/ murein hydrolase activator NlpD